MSKRWLLLLALLGLTVSGCVSEVRSTLDPLGPVAKLETDTFMVTLWVSLALFASVGSFMVYCLVKYHHRGEVTKDTPLPEQTHGSAVTEIFLIMLSVTMVGVIAIPAIQGIFYVGTVPQNEKVYEVNVTGYQWWWKFEYPEYGVVTANEIAIPAGRPVKFNLKTQDVIHAFWVPRLGGKMDLAPGQDNWLWLQADPDLLAKTNQQIRTSDNKPGMRFEHLPDDYPFQGYVLYGQCAEFCGASHAFMQFRVLVLDDDNFQKWIAWQKSNSRSTLPDGEAQAASALFKQNRCGTCHTIRGVSGAGGQVGPDLTHVGSRTSIAAGWLENTEANLAHWISHPDDVKPDNIMWVTGYKHEVDGKVINPAGTEVNDDERDRIAKYLYSLK